MNSSSSSPLNSAIRVVVMQRAIIAGTPWRMINYLGCLILTLKRRILITNLMLIVLIIHNVLN